MEDFSANDNIEQAVSQIIREDLKLGDNVEITNDMSLLGSDVDLDSLDSLLLITSIEKRFGIKVPSERIDAEVFQNVSTISDFVRQHLNRAERVEPGRLAIGDVQALLDHLPHGASFIFISQLLRIDPGKSGTGQWCPTGQEPLLAGHFPGQPVVPGVLIIEALAQLSGLVAVTMQQTEGSRMQRGAIVHVDLRCLRPVIPPATIDLSSTQVRAVGDIYSFEVTAAVDGQLIAQGEIALALGTDDQNTEPVRS